jgi:hypothetical protein
MVYFAETQIDEMEVAHQKALCLWIEQAMMHLWGTVVLDARRCVFDMDHPLSSAMVQGAYEDMWAFLQLVTPHVQVWKETMSFYERHAAAIMTDFNNDETLARRLPRQAVRQSVRGVAAQAVRQCTVCGGKGISLVYACTGKCRHCMQLPVGDGI